MNSIFKRCGLQIPLWFKINSQHNKLYNFFLKNNVIVLKKREEKKSKKKKKNCIKFLITKEKICLKRINIILFGL